MENQKNRAVIRPESTSNACEETQNFLDSTIREALLEFCSLYSQDLNPTWPVQWTASLSHLSPDVLRRALAEVPRTFIPTTACPFPTPAHVLKFTDHVDQNMLNSEAEVEWERVLTLRRTEWNPDMPDYFARAFSELPVQTQAAARASGIFAQADMEPEQLHVWAKRKFVEAYARWKEKVHLLPDGPVKDALTDLARAKALPERKSELNDSARPMRFMSEQLAEMKARGWVK